MRVYNDITAGTKRKGFTLVELSMVLVVVGLLIGGILAGKSMIESANTQKVITLANQYKIAFIRFTEVTQYMPGDAPAGVGIPTSLDGSSAFRGNGNGTLHENDETVKSLGHMVVLGLMHAKNDIDYFRSVCDRTSLATIQCYIEGPHSESVFKDRRAYDNSGVISMGNYGAEAAPGTVQNNEYFIGYGHYVNSSSLTHSSQNALLTSIQALAIDKKADDGIATTGEILGYKGQGCAWPGCDCLDDGDFRDGDPNEGESYLLSKNDAQCIMYFSLIKNESFNMKPY